MNSTAATHLTEAKPPLSEEVDAAELLRLASISETAGRWTEAVERFEQAFSVGLNHFAPGLSVDALRGLARLRGRTRRFEEAEELVELSRFISLAHGLEREAIRSLNIAGLIKYWEGRYSDARRIYEAALTEARDVGDGISIGWICQNLGVLSNIQGDHREARLWYLESIAATVASGDDLIVNAVYNNLGMVCADLHEWLEADLYFDRGIEVARRIGDRVQLARLCLNKAEPLIEMGNLAEAVETLDEAETISGEIRDSGVLCEVSHFRGRIARLEKEFDAARRWLERALELARSKKLQLSEAEALREMALLHWECGRRTEAYSDASEALSLFRKLGASHDAASLTLLLESWS
jgi:tetratricopeptide (TPR) repeat protein